jgi:hypothetical protein
VGGMTFEDVQREYDRGSPNTINPMLDAWWKTLSARLDSGPPRYPKIPKTQERCARDAQTTESEEASLEIEYRLSVRVSLAANDSTRKITIDGNGLRTP